MSPNPATATSRCSVRISVTWALKVNKTWHPRRLPDLPSCGPLWVGWKFYNDVGEPARADNNSNNNSGGAEMDIFSVSREAAQHSTMEPPARKASNIQEAAARKQSTFDRRPSADRRQSYAPAGFGTPHDPSAVRGFRFISVSLRVFHSFNVSSFTCLDSCSLLLAGAREQFFNWRGSKIKFWYVT